jgi:LmbE family N-acetylglucosaminyl deacetylase
VHTGPVLAVFAHPDDAEIAAGGTLTKWARAGREVHLLVLTNGDRGSQDASRDRAELARTRLAETEAAAELMGLSSVRILSVHDGELENTIPVREAVVRRIREVHASTVLSVDPTMIFFGNRYYNHTDHRTAGFIALDAAAPASGNPHFFPEHFTQGLAVQHVEQIWLGWTAESNHAEDITGLFETKVAALAAHESQLHEGIAFFEEMLEGEATEAGTTIGVDHAEAFRVLDLG